MAAHAWRREERFINNLIDVKLLRFLRGSSAAPALGTPVWSGGDAGGDLYGTYPDPWVYGLYGVPIYGAGPVNGNVLTYDAANGWWYAAAVPPTEATAHHASHELYGSDSIKLDDLDLPDDNTDLNASTARHGLMPKLGPGTTQFMREDGTWQTPAAATDAAAIHDNVASEISALTEKVTPVDADLLLIEDSADSNAKKKVQVGHLPGGVAGDYFTYFDPDAPPASPSALDDHFDQASLAGKWTQFQNIGLTITMEKHAVVLSAAWNAGGDKVQGIFQALPGGDWSVMAKLGGNLAVTDFFRMGLALFQDATNNPNTTDLYLFGFDCSTAGGIRIQGHLFSDYQTWVSTLFTSATAPELTLVYLKISKYGTNYEFLIGSPILGWRSLYYGTLAFSPAEIGLVISNGWCGYTNRLYTDWFRYYSYDPGLGGNLRTVGAGSPSGDETTTDTYANRPAAGNGGNLFLPSDGMAIDRDSGAAWSPWGPIFPLTRPVPADFSWVNQGTATLDTAHGGMTVSEPTAGGTNMRIQIKTAPSTPYTIEILFLVNLVGTNYPHGGFVWRQSSDGKLVSIDVVVDGNVPKIQSNRWNSPSSFNAGTLNVVNAMLGSLFWLKITDDGSSRKAYSSQDGLHWQLEHQQGHTDFITPDQVGFYVDANNSTYPQSITLLSWKQS